MPNQPTIVGSVPLIIDKIGTYSLNITKRKERTMEGERVSKRTPTAVAAGSKATLVAALVVMVFLIPVRRGRPPPEDEQPCVKKAGRVPKWAKSWKAPKLHKDYRSPNFIERGSPAM